MPGINQNIFDKQIGFAANLTRVEANDTAEIYAKLDRLKQEITATINSIDVGTLEGAAQVAALEELKDRVSVSIISTYDDIADFMDGDLQAIASLTSTNTINNINTSVGFDLATTTLAPDVLRSLTNQNIIMGARSRDWWLNQGENLRFEFDAEMSQGVLLGESTQDLVSRVRGNPLLANSGVMGSKYYQAASLVRTSVVSTSNHARMLTFQANDDILDGIEWVSTLDSHTSDTCKGLDGLKWTLDYKPIGHSVPYPGATAHWQCRSTQIPIVKPFNGLPAEKQALFDRGLRLEKGASGEYGKVDSRIKYNEWLKTQPSDFQKEVLGATKYKIWKEKGLSLTDMLDQSGNAIPATALATIYNTNPSSDFIETLSTPAGVKEFGVNSTIYGAADGISEPIGDVIDDTKKALAQIDDYTATHSQKFGAYDKAAIADLRKAVESGNAKITTNNRLMCSTWLTDEDYSALRSKRYLLQTINNDSIIVFTGNKADDFMYAKMTNIFGDDVIKVDMAMPFESLHDVSFFSDGSIVVKGRRLGRSMLFSQYAVSENIRYNADAVEYLLVYDENGKPIRTVTEMYSRGVDYSDFDVDNGVFRDSYIFHNHPSNTTLSDSDLTNIIPEDFKPYLGAKEIYAVGQTDPVYFGAALGVREIPIFTQGSRIDSFGVISQALEKAFHQEMDFYFRAATSNKDVLNQYGYDTIVNAFGKALYHTRNKLLNDMGYIRYTYGTFDGSTNTSELATELVLKLSNGRFRTEQAMLDRIYEKANKLIEDNFGVTIP